MNIFKTLRIALATLLIGGAAFAANIQLRSGPVDVADLRSIINQLVLDINAGVAGDLYSNATAVNTTAVTTEETLFTYTLPANTLAAYGDAVRIQCSELSAATANNKTLRLYFGASVITTGAVASNGTGMFLEATVIRGASATAQAFVGRGVAGVTPVAVTNTAGTDNLAADVVIKCTGQNAVAVANDMSGKMMLVEMVK